MAKKKGIPGLSFSWKRAIGVSQAKSNLSRKIGIPLTRQARQRKIGAATGCAIPLAVGIAGFLFLGGSAISYAQEPTQQLPCDWTVTKTIDQMTDEPRCMVMSASAKIGLSVDRDGVLFVTGSAYKNGRDGLRVRVDQNDAVSITSRGRTTKAFEDDARIAVRQIMTGKRIRTSFLDYPYGQEGDAAICNLPELLQECGAPMERIMDTRSQLEKIRSRR